MVFICIPVHNRVDYTTACLNSIFCQTYKNFHVVISDAGSTDGTIDVITEKFPQKVTLLPIDPSNWWTGGINACIRYAMQVGNANDFIFTLNNDTEIASDCLRNLVNYANNNPGSLIGGLNLFYDDRSRIEPSAFSNEKCGIFYYQKRLFSLGQKIPVPISESYPVDTLSGKGILIPVSVFRKIGLFEEKLLPHYHADTEFVNRSRVNGFNPVLLTTAKIYSHVKETGTGTIDKSSIGFFKSYFHRNSANHLKSLFSYSRLVYKKAWLLYFIPKIVLINAGFIKRLLYKSPIIHKFTAR